jgi:hypothetical protein
MKKSVFISALFLITCSSHALERRITDGLHIAPVTSGDIQDDTIAFGWQGAYDFSRWLTTELSYSYYEDSLPQETLDSILLPVGSRVDTDVHEVDLTGRIHLLHNEVASLYAGAGINMLFINEDAEGVNKAIAANRGSSPISDFSVDVKKDIGFHTVIGGEISLNNHWEIFAEWRYVLQTLETDFRLVSPAGNGQTSTREIDRDVGFDHQMVRFGANYRF